MSADGLFAIVDVTDWEIDGDEALGTKPKNWVRHPGTNELWLCKRVHRKVGNSGEERVGEDWAEKLVAEVARALGIPAAVVELAVDKGSRASISQTIRSDGEDLVHGNELLSRGQPNYPVGENMPRGHTVDACVSVLDELGVVDATHSATGAIGFAQYLALDALVGNTDRHHQNWGILQPHAGQARLAPSFDHGSSLGFSLSDGERARRLNTRDEGFSVKHWAARAQSKFFHERDRLDLVNAAHRASLLTGYPLSSFVETFEAKRDSLGDLVDRLPATRMSNEAKDFARGVLNANQQRFMEELAP